MRHHSLICRLGIEDTDSVTLARAGSHVTPISFIDREHRLSFGIGQALDALHALGFRPSEAAVDLALLAALVMAADTRVSRDSESQESWTRQIDLYLPVAAPATWSLHSGLIVKMLNFLTGDRWGLYFRRRPAALPSLAPPVEEAPAAYPSCVCLFSGGLDSFIGAIDLVAGGARPLLVTHYWDGITSKHQRHCYRVLTQRFPDARLQHLRARVGFPRGMVVGSRAEDTMRGRSFLFFALAMLAASGIPGGVVVHVPENGLISLNVPLDPLRLGALSTRTTHPYYMARFNDLLHAVGILARVENRYRHRTKGQMVRECADPELLRREAKNTMSCAAPTKYRFSRDEAQRTPRHCGHCVPCLIRRAALQYGLGRDDTTYAIPDLHARVLNAAKAEGQHVRSFQLALARLVARPGRARFDVHRPGPLSDHPEDLAAYERVYCDGMDEVARLLTNVRVQPA